MASSSSLSHSLLGSLLRFLSRPDGSLPQLCQSPLKTGLAILRLYALQLSMILVLIIVLHPIQSRFLTTEEHAISNFVSEVSIGQFVFFSVIAAPLLEELIFRLPLRLSTLNLCISLSCLMALFLGLGPFPLNLICGALLGYGLARLLGEDPQQQGPLQIAYQRYYPPIFYGTVVLFGLIHLTNYLDLEGPWFLMPLLVVPQGVIGLFLGFIRLRYGFWWAVLSHSIHNFSLTVPLLLTHLGSEALRQQMLDSGEREIADLSPQDQWILLMVGGVSLGVVLLCAQTAHQLIREWLQEDPPPALPPVQR